jgi:hypothetical protein
MNIAQIGLKFKRRKKSVSFYDDDDNEARLKISPLLQQLRVAQVYIKYFYWHGVKINALYNYTVLT